jgi:hypothetical protein
MQDWRYLISKLDILDDQFGAREVTLIYVYSQQTQADVIRHAEHKKMAFQEFIEAIGRVADRKDLTGWLESQGYGTSTPSEFKTLDDDEQQAKISNNIQRAMTMMKTDVARTARLLRQESQMREELSGLDGGPGMGNLATRLRVVLKLFLTPLVDVHVAKTKVIQRPTLLGEVQEMANFAKNKGFNKDKLSEKPEKKLKTTVSAMLALKKGGAKKGGALSMLNRARATIVQERATEVGR